MEGLNIRSDPRVQQLWVRSVDNPVSVYDWQIFEIIRH